METKLVLRGIIPALWLCLLFFTCLQPVWGQNQETDGVQNEKSKAVQAPKKSQNSAVQEDVNEFLGYEDLLLVRYISLPYDIVMNTNVVSYFVDLGFILIIFLPFVYLLGGRAPWYYQLGFIAICIVFLLLSVPSALTNKNKVGLENTEAFLTTETATHAFSKEPLVNLAFQLKKPFIKGYQEIYPALQSVSGASDRVTYPILLLLLVLAIILLERRIQHHTLGTRVILQFLLCFSFLWLLLSSGIPWYGLLLFPLFLLFIVRGVSATDASSEREQRTRKTLLLTATAIWAIMAFAYRFSNYEPNDAERAKLPFMAAVSQFQIGQQDQDFVFDRIFPQYRKALQFINRENTSYVYRVGTLMPFFIPKNDRRVLSDNFLDFFQNLAANYPNPQELALALRAYGFRYIIVDLNLSVNDHTVEGSLKNKFQQFMNFIYQNPHLQLVATDRITRGADGTPMFQVFPDGNTVENAGWFAVYQII